MKAKLNQIYERYIYEWEQQFNMLILKIIDVYGRVVFQ